MDKPVVELNDEEWQAMFGPDPVPTPKYSGLASGVAGLGLSALDGLTFGYGDELVGAGSAGVSKLMGDSRSYGAIRDAETQKARDIQDQFQNAHPVMNLGANLVGGFKNPVSMAGKISSVASKLPVIGKLGGVLGMTGDAALQSGAYGFGEGEGGIGNRLAEAGQGAKLGAGFGGVIGSLGAIAGGIGRASKGAAKEFERSAYGITKSAINASEKQLADTAEGALSEIPLYTALDEFNASRTGKSIKGEDLLSEARTQSGNLAKQLRGELTGLKQTDVVVPSFSNAASYIEKEVSSTQKAEAKKIFDKLKSDIIDGSDGTILSLQDEKVNLGKRLKGAFGEDSASQLEKNILKRMYSDLRTEIEDGAQQFGGSKDRVKGLNEQLRNRENLDVLFSELKKTDNVSDPYSKFLQGMRTSGGLGSLAIAATTGGAIGGPAGIAGGLLLPTAIGGVSALAQSRSGKNILSQVANRLGSASNIDTKLLGNIGALAKGYNAAQYGDREGEGINFSNSFRPRDPYNTQLGVYVGQPGQAGQQSGISQTVNNPSINANPGQSPSQQEKQVIELSDQEWEAMFGKDTPTEPNLPAPTGTPLASALMRAESNGDPRAVSSAGAQGLFQLMPDTGRELAAKMGVKYDPYNAEQNALLGTTYLNQMLSKYGGDQDLALAAYNWGPGNLDKLIKTVGTTDYNMLRRFLPEETRQHRDRTMKYLAQMA